MSNKANWFENVEERSHPWPGLKWLTPGIIVADVNSAVNFYTEAMELVLIAEAKNDEDDLIFARIRYRGVNFTVYKENFDSDVLSPASTGHAPPLLFYLYVDHVRELTDKMSRAGAEILTEPAETFWGDLRARLKDPFGYVWDIAQKL